MSSVKGEGGRNHGYHRNEMNCLQPSLALQKQFDFYLGQQLSVITEGEEPE